MRRQTLMIGLAGALAWAPLGVAQAQTLEDKLRAQLTSTLEQLHALEDSQASLQAEKASAEQERDALKAKLAAGGGRAAPGGLQAALDQEKAENAKLTQTIQQDQADIAKYKDAYTQVADANQQVHAERDRLAQAANSSSDALADCETKNIALVKIGRDVLSAYTRVGVFDAMKRGEPFIGLKRVQMERIAQDYGDQVYQAKFDPNAVKAKKPAPAAQAAQGAPTAPPPVSPTPPSAP